MKLSEGEKLILVMLAGLYKKLGIKDDIDPDLVLASVLDDKTWGLRWKYQWLGNGEVNPPEVDETVRILNMYRAITSSLHHLSPQEQARVQAETDPFSGYLKFQGFDANNDDHYGVVHYLVHDLGRFSELDDSYQINSHSSGTLLTYRRMLEVLEKHGHERRTELTADELIEVVRAGR